MIALDRLIFEEGYYRLFSTLRRLGAKLVAIRGALLVLNVENKSLVSLILGLTSNSWT